MPIMKRTKKKNSILKQKGGKITAAMEHVKLQPKFNIRKESEVDPELLSSVAEHGVLNPVHVRWKDDKEKVLYVVDGHRRYRANKEAEWTEIPVVCRGHLTDQEALIISLTTNENQKPLTRAERAEGFKRLRDSGLKEKDIADVMCCSKRTVAETLRLVDKAVAPLRKAVLEGKVERRAGARASSTLPKKVQKELVDDLDGKTFKEGVKIVQDKEGELGLVPKQTRKRVTTKNAKPRNLETRLAEIMAELRKAVKTAPTNRTYKVQLKLCEVLRGNGSIRSLFETAKPKAKAEPKAKKKAKKKIIRRRTKKEG